MKIKDPEPFTFNLPKTEGSATSIIFHSAALMC